MNLRLIGQTLSFVLFLEAALMVPSCVLSLCYQDGALLSFLLTMAALLACGFPLFLWAKPSIKLMRPREGMTVAVLSWLLLIAFGALPYVFSGMIPNYFEALFESVSGFTTTGASLLTQYDGQPRSLMFWRSFTQWLGGMGVLVLTLAILPKVTDRSSHMVRAESPGPSLSKLVPRLGDSSKILYLLYGFLTLLLAVVLIALGMTPYDAFLHALSTAGTGGFSNYEDSIAHFASPAIELALSIFMVLFSINFALYYRLLAGPRREALKSEELRWFLGIMGGSVALIAILILPQYGHFFTALRHSFFQVSSLMSTTGFAHQHYTLWVKGAQAMIFLLLFVGACAGSTAGGLKVVRISLLFKMAGREIRHAFQPRKMQVVRFDGKGVEENMLNHVAIFFFLYILFILGGTLLISLDNFFAPETALYAAITCMSNVGPGFAPVGLMENFNQFSTFSKGVMCLMMLAGRLEIYPVLVLLHPGAWRRQ